MIDNSTHPVACVTPVERFTGPGEASLHRLPMVKAIATDAARERHPRLSHEFPKLLRAPNVLEINGAARLAPRNPGVSFCETHFGVLHGKGDNRLALPAMQHSTEANDTLPHSVILPKNGGNRLLPCK